MGSLNVILKWADEMEAELALKLVSRDCDWTVEYERFRLSPQPDYYFAESPGYTKRVSATGPRRQR